MTEIALYNTRTRRKEPLVPLDPANVRMYVCGPTVYDRAHIGNARAVVVFDVLFRLLRHTYGTDHVTYVRNFTDVDDKINARAAATKLPGETELDAIRRITDETIGWYHADMDALGNLRPTFEPRATEFIAPMLAMIEVLIARGHAYAAEGHVLFSVASYPDYGKLARRSLDDMRAGARVEVAPYKRDPMDFVLWKPSDATQPGWDSPWGRGRPGWHIECSAMAYDLLGPSFDIHGGGIDLAFPHHENELAQSACAHPEGDFARIWMHNGMLNVEGDKMSKSLGNFFTVRDLLDRGIPGEVIRFVLLSTHYRQPLDWTNRKMKEAYSILLGWARMTEGIEHSPNIDERIIKALADDLNTPNALAVLHELARCGEEKLLAASMQLGIDFTQLGQGVASIGIKMEHRIRALLIRRDQARAEKNFALSDSLRGYLQASGVAIEDGSGASWRVSPEHDAFGWTTLLGLARKGKLRLSEADVYRLGEENDVIFNPDSTATTSGTLGIVNAELISLAEAEAFT